MIIARRKFITGAAALIASPAIVRAASIMKVRPIPLYVLPSFYVSPDGDDFNSGMDRASPFRTIQRAVDVANQLLKYGGHISINVVPPLTGNGRIIFSGPPKHLAEALCPSRRAIFCPRIS